MGAEGGKQKVMMSKKLRKMTTGYRLPLLILICIVHR